MKEKCIFYIRVSSKEQEREGFSIPAQKKLLKEYSENNDFSIIQIFEESETAKKAGRTQFKKMLELLGKDKTIQHVLVEKTDRLYRNFHDYVALDCEQGNIFIHLVKENIVFSSESKSNEKFMHGIKVLMAKNYIDNLSEEVKKGQNEKVSQGGWPGKAPLGYRNRLEDHTIVIHKENSLIIQKAFELAASGLYSLSKLKKELYRMGLRSPRAGKELSKEQMRRTLKNPFYYGHFEWKGKLYKGKHRQIISKTLWDKTQEAMSFIINRPKVSKKDFIFRNLLTCGHCGCSITAEQKTKKSGRIYIYYRCTNGKGICKNITYLREEKIEDVFLKAIEKIKLTPDIIEETRRALMESSKDEKVFRENQINEFSMRYKKLDYYIDQAYQDKLDGYIEPSHWEQKTAEWKNEQENIENQLTVLRKTNTAYMIEGIKLMEIVNKATSLFKKATLDEKREILNLVLSNPKVINGSIEYHYKKPFDMFVNVVDLEKWRE